MTTLTVRELWQYPLKSGQGNPLSSTTINTYGVAHDRHILAIDDDQHPGLFLSARATPELLQLAIAPGKSADDQWTITDRRDGDTLAFTPASLTKPQSARVWKDEASGLDLGDAAADWLSARVGQRARLIFWQPGNRHSEKYDVDTTYADAAPLLITSSASIAQACSWSGLAPDTRRFRPNIVIDGAEAFAEEQWRRIRIGEVEFVLLDDCTRCILVTRDPDTGEKQTSNSTLKMLKDNNPNAAGKPILGMNATLAPGTAEARIAVGDVVTIID